MIRRPNGQMFCISIKVTTLLKKVPLILVWRKPATQFKPDFLTTIKMATWTATLPNHPLFQVSNKDREIARQNPPIDFEISCIGIMAMYL